MAESLLNKNAGSNKGVFQLNCFNSGIPGNFGLIITFDINISSDKVRSDPS